MRNNATSRREDVSASRGVVNLNSSEIGGCVQVVSIGASQFLCSVACKVMIIVR